jgi:hypothetical protein
MHRFATPVLLALLAPLAPPLAAPAAAGTLAGVTLPDQVDAGGHALVLNGMALRSKLFVKVYVGGLYLPARESSAAAVLAADAPRRMVLDFIYDVGKDQMCDAWEEGLEANTPNASAEVRQGFATLCSWMEGVGKGQRLTLTYLPGQGTEVALGDTVKGTLPGKPTADAVLSTWIGPKPGPGGEFKRRVLGQ